jgi:hypothetical protein
MDLSVAAVGQFVRWHKEHGLVLVLFFPLPPMVFHMQFDGEQLDLHLLILGWIERFFHHL